MMCHKCKRCNKDTQYDKKHKRYRVFCSDECKKLYFEEKRIQEHDKHEHRCIICGKEAFYVEKYDRWLKTCNSEECRKECSRLAQKKGTPGRTKYNIPKENLEKLYIEENRTRLEIAKVFGCSEAQIKKLLKRYNISKDYPLRMVRIADTKEKKYGDKGFVNHEKAKKTCLQKYGVSTNLLLLDAKQSVSRISKSEIQWLDDLNIVTRQHRIKLSSGYTFVDGFDQTTNTIYEFFGDYWHSNPKDYNDEYFNESMKQTAKEIREKDSIRFKELRNLGYNIKFVWESDYKYNKLLYSEFNDYLL